MNRFWNWTVNNEADETEEPRQERGLSLDGVIAEESWFEDDVTPKVFSEELNADSGDVTVRINSPGGDVFAAAQIYNMLREYSQNKGKVTVKIDSLAASAASVIAMAGDEVLMSPVSMLMIHNPSTIAAGERRDMEQAINMLDAVKNSIIEAYRKKTGISEKALSDMMNDETWMNANMAIKKHFADGYIGEKNPAENAVMFARVPFMKKVTAQIGTQNKAIPADELYSRLHKLKSNF